MILRRSAITALAVAGVCGPAFAADLAGSEWGAKGKPERFIQFQQGGKVSGSSGCNRFVGTYNISGNKLTFGPLAGTRMMCSPKRMKAEKRFLAALNGTRTMKRGKKRLKLFDEKGKKLVALRHRDWD